MLKVYSNCTGVHFRPPVFLSYSIVNKIGPFQAQHGGQKFGGSNFGKDTVGNEEYYQNIPWCKST